MTDRELLEQAAKAAGYSINFEGPVNGFYVNGYDENGDPATRWNPLTDDGDALRLAVKLELDIFNSCISVRVIHRDKDMGATIKCRGNTTQMEPYAATRRAIVRAAAEIGKEQK